MVHFGWFVTINTLLTVSLEDPLVEGGLGFTPQRSAACIFTIVLFRVFQLIASGHVLPIGRPYRTELAGSAINDRLPPGIYKRRGGTVRPEYRLHRPWIPGLSLRPVGLGIFRAALEYLCTRWNWRLGHPLSLSVLSHSCQ